MMDSAVVPLALAPHETGIEVTVRAWPAASALHSAATGVVFAGRRGQRCHAPVHLQLRRSGSQLTASWIRRTRVDGDNWGFADVPLGEAEEAYEVSLLGPQGELRRERVSSASWQADIGELAALAGAGVEVLTLSIAQISQASGAGLTVRADIAL